MKKIIFNIEPHTKPRMSSSDRWEKRKCVVDYWEYKNRLNSIAKNNGFKIGNILSIKFYISMPNGWSKKKKIEMNNTPHQQTPDIDNLIKGFTDALLENDSHIWNILASKVWAEKGFIEVFYKEEKGGELWKQK